MHGQLQREHWSKQNLRSTIIHLPQQHKGKRLNKIWKLIKLIRMLSKQHMTMQSQREMVSNKLSIKLLLKEPIPLPKKSLRKETRHSMMRKPKREKKKPQLQDFKLSTMPGFQQEIWMPPMMSSLMNTMPKPLLSYRHFKRLKEDLKLPQTSTTLSMLLRPQEKMHCCKHRSKQHSNKDLMTDCNGSPIFKEMHKLHRQLSPTITQRSKMQLMLCKLTLIKVEMRLTNHI